MTKEEVKATYTVPDILSRYGVMVKRGRCRAICHVGQHYTAKVSNDLYYCFKCGISMDIFDLMMHFNHCDFKTAYELLGGGEKPSFRATIVAKRQKKEQQERQHKKQIVEQQWLAVKTKLAVCYAIAREEPPFTDLWCNCMNQIPYLEYRFEGLLEERARCGY